MQTFELDPRKQLSLLWFPWGIWTSLGSLWVQEWEKFYLSQETAWEQGGLPEEENNAPEEGSKSTKKKHVFFV